MKRERRPASPQIPLPREEWMMWRLCPDDQLEECFVYEIARRSDMWRAIAATAGEGKSMRRYNIDPNGWASIYQFLSSFPSFISTPWLAQPPSLREQVMADLYARCHHWDPIQKIEEWQIEAGILQDQPHEEGGPWWNKVELFSRYRSRCLKESTHVLTIRLDWLRRDEELIKFFPKWLKKTRPLDYAAYAMPGKVGLRPDVLRSALRGIGALSWLRRCRSQETPRLTFSEAFKLARFKNETGANETLFPDEREMRRAAKTAEEIISDTTPWRLELRPNDVTNQPKGTEAVTSVIDGKIDVERLMDGSIRLKRRYIPKRKAVG
jgi:hypothetical protein